jgi:hypothetical protein
MRTIIDNCPEIKITNTAQLPRGLGARLLLAVKSPYEGEYVAERWLRKMPETTPSHKVVIRF